MADRAKLANFQWCFGEDEDGCSLSLSFGGETRRVGARISALQVLSTISERTGGAVRTS